MADDISAKVGSLLLPDSLPDQLPISNKSSTYSNEEQVNIKHTKIKFPKLPKTPNNKHFIHRRYFTSRTNINETNARNLKEEISPFEYPKGMKIFAHKVLTKAWRNDLRVKELQEKLFNKTSYSKRRQKDLLNCLYVKEPKLIEGKGVLNMDPNYYNTVGERPIREKQNTREYIQTIRNALRTKIVTGFREDDIILIDETMKLEQKLIDTINENLQSYVNAFENFLRADHKTAIDLLRESDNIAAVAYNKSLELKAIAKKYANLRSSLYAVEEKWKMCKTYQKFLYQVSPLTWRMLQEAPETRRTSIYMMDQDPHGMKGIFGNFRTSLVREGLSLEHILEEFKREAASDTPATLYFAEPEELLDVFRFTEMQNLNYLLYTEQLAVPIANIREGIFNAVRLFDEEIKKIQEMIEQLDRGILWEENHAQYLEDLGANLIKKELKNLIIHENILSLEVAVEDIYTSAIGPNDANLPPIDMMKTIEDKYRKQLLFFDKIPREQFKFLEGSYYKEQIYVMRLAEEAAKQYDKLEKITESVKKAFEPPPPKAGRKALKKRSPPVDQLLRVDKTVETAKKLTKDEETYLEHFTQYCEFTDDPRNFEIKADEVARFEDMIER